MDTWPKPKKTASRLTAGLLLALALSPAASGAGATPVQVLSNQFPQCVFANGTRAVTVSLRNASDQPVAVAVTLRRQQAATATAASWGDTPWKKIQVLGGQTILETAHVEFPAVTAETRFILQWIDGTNQVLGRTEVLAYPSDLLKELKLLAGKAPVGVFDPQNELRPALKNSGVEFFDMEAEGLDKFYGKLAIVGPFGVNTPVPEDLTQRVAALVRKGTAVVWLQPPPRPHRELQPSFYSVSVGVGVAVVVQSALVPHLLENPESQLNLLHCARLAVRPEPNRLPHVTALTQQ